VCERKIMDSSLRGLSQKRMPSSDIAGLNLNGRNVNGGSTIGDLGTQDTTPAGLNPSLRLGAGDPAA
jgi:hypothetical protein